MDRSVLLDLYDRELRVELETPGVRKETFPGVVRCLRPAPGMNYVSYSHLDEAILDRVIAEQIAFFSPLEQPFSWHVYEHDAPASLKDRLLRHGFADDDDPDATMILELAQAPDRLLNRRDQAVRRLTRPVQLEAAAQIEAQVWGGDFGWLLRRLGPHLEIPGYLSVYAAYVQGNPASTGWIYFYPGSQFAGLFGGATLARHRGRGFYTAILAARAREARERGYRYLTTGASPMSRPILEDNGFSLLTCAFALEWRGPAG